ncbi:Rv0518 family GDSL lipase [Mycobacterium sp. NPDC051804]|uniref:Rv0518 family GDSL lipase n=1 Tax=Mycobacterium sp. NPDC051804 TaxID=3364295 RepID=UPI0037905062
MRRLITAMLALALLVSVSGERPTRLGHNGSDDVAMLNSSMNRIAVIGDSYTTGTDIGGLGRAGWTARAWDELANHRMTVSADVGAEGGAGYGTRGNQGSIFEDLTARTIKPDDSLVVFFGSRNDLNVDPAQLSILAYGTFQLARRIAPSATFLVIGPPWPTADPPANLVRIRDALQYQAGVAGATFVDPIAERWFVGRPGLIGSDGVHPTNAGHQYMADKIAPLIAAQLPVRL